ncbi:MAG: right-handed parallel beta-helix repeat-containing protein [Rubritalea sp.]
MVIRKLCITLSLLLLYAGTLSAKQTTLRLEETTTLDGSKIKHRPGDVFKIKDGKYSSLTIKNFQGSADAPITFINSGGIAEFDSREKGNSALTISGCKHIRLTGSGDTQNRYGIRAACGKKGPHAVNVIGRSSSIEIDHIEVFGAGFAGFNVKDEPSMQHKTTRDQFTMRNIALHDNYVHDVKGEGFYIGHTFYDGYDPKKTGKPTMPHLIEGLRLYNNICKDTGCEGIQVGSASEDCEIYNNTILNSGVSPFAEYQDNGMQIGAGTQAKVYDNLIDTCPSNGFVVFGYGKVNIENNLVRNPGKSGMYINTKGGDHYLIQNNTFDSPNDDGVLIGNWKKPPATMELLNNLFILKNSKSNAIVNQNTKAKLTDKKNRTLSQSSKSQPRGVGADLKFTKIDDFEHVSFTTKAPTPFKEPEH